MELENCSIFKCCNLILHSLWPISIITLDWNFLKITQGTVWISCKIWFSCLRSNPVDFISLCCLYTFYCISLSYYFFFLGTPLSSYSYSPVSNDAYASQTTVPSYSQVSDSNGSNSSLTVETEKQCGMKFFLKFIYNQLLKYDKLCSYIKYKSLYGYFRSTRGFFIGNHNMLDYFTSILIVYFPPHFFFQALKLFRGLSLVDFCLGKKWFFFYFVDSYFYQCFKLCHKSNIIFWQTPPPP